MASSPCSRRAALGRLSALALSVPLLNLSAQTAPTPSRTVPLRLGLATYSFRKLSVDEMLPLLKDLRIENVGPFRTHVPWAGSEEECRAVAERFRAAGMTLTGSGVFRLTNDDAALRTAFTNARAAGLATMVCSPEKEALPKVERFVREFDQRIAIHNHGPEDKVYPSPRDIWTAIESLDQRIGVCIDVAHTARAGDDPVEMIRLCASRLYDFHLRDTVSPVGAMKDQPTEVGAGRLDIPGILRALLDVDYQGVVALEYEKDGNVLAGVAESFGYIRGCLAALSRT